MKPLLVPSHPVQGVASSPEPIANVGGKSEAQIEKDQTTSGAHRSAALSPVKSPDSKSSILFSNKVTVLGLEEGFQSSVLLYFINFAMKDLYDDKPAFACRTIDTTSAEVEFTSVQAAASSCILDIRYGNREIKLEHKIAHTNKVKVTGLEEDFEPSVLLFLLNMSLTDNPALKCDRMGPTSAVVEFTSNDAAAVYCKLNLHYGRAEKVTIQLCSIPDVEVIKVKTVSR